MNCYDDILYFFVGKGRNKDIGKCQDIEVLSTVFLIDIIYNSIFHVFYRLQRTNPLFAQKVEDNVKLKN